MIESIKDNNAIVVISVQHTGTWFLLNLLANHPQVSVFDEMWQVNSEDIIRNHLLHTHTGYIPEGVESESKFSDYPFLDDLCKNCRTVSPIRDPLASLITRHERQPGEDKKYIIDGFLWMSGTTNNVYFPVDLEGKDKTDLVHQTFRGLDLSYAFYTVKDFINRWEPINTRGDYHLKSLYKARNLPRIRKELPEGVDYLLENKDALEPFMRSLGYNNLMWY